MDLYVFWLSKLLALLAYVLLPFHNYHSYPFICCLDHVVLSFLSSLIAKCSALVRLSLGGWEALSTQFILALSASASCWLSLVKAASMAVMYSKLRGCFGETRKLGPLASTDLCALVKGLLDKLITHFGLSSSKEEEPWRLLYILGRGEDLASWKTLAWEDAAWETLLSCWEIVLSTLGVLPSCLEELLGVWPACLPRWIRGITCLGIVIRGSLWGPKACRAPNCWDCLGEDCTLCLGKSAICWRSLGDCTLCLGKSAVCWGSLGIACLGDSALCLGKCAVCLGRLGTACLGDCTLCLGKSAICWRSLGDCTLCLGKSAIYWGSLGNCLPEKFEGKA